MKPEYQMLSFHIIEKFNNNKLITWTYPCISDQVKTILLEKVLSEDAVQEFLYYRSKANDWIYIWERSTESKIYALALVTKVFNPNKFVNFGQTLCLKYERNFNPVQLVEIFLGAFTKGTYTHQVNGTQVLMDLNNYNAKIHIKDFINLFKLEIILIYNALLLKKRVLVYHSNISFLFKHLQSITCLMDSKFRDPNDYLFPLVKNINMELKGKSFFVAGIRDKNINTKPNNYDLFVNLQTQAINITPQSKEIFGMTKVHKEVAKLIVQCVEDENCDDAMLVNKLNEKTEEILLNLNGLAKVLKNNKMMLTIDDLRERKLNPVMENFLFNLAIAESMMIL